MKHLKIFEKYNKDIEETILKIKRELVFEYLSIADDEEFEDSYNGNLDDAWEDFIHQQEIGDCQSIVNTIETMNLPDVDVEAHFGEIEVDEPSYFEEEEYSEEDDDYIMVEKENYLFTHHWITINNKIYEFSKGTLKDNIEWEDLYDVDSEGEDKYIGIS